MGAAVDPRLVPVRPGETAAVGRRSLERRVGVLERSPSVGPGGITSTEVDTLDIDKLTGVLVLGDDATVDVGALTGTLQASDAAIIDVGALTGTLDAGDDAAIDVEVLTGTLTAGDNADINVGALAGELGVVGDAKVNVAAWTGHLTDAHDATIGASSIVTTNIDALNGYLGQLVIATGGAILLGTAGGVRVDLTGTGIRGYSDATTVSFALDAVTGKVITLAGIGGDNLLLNSSAERPDGAITPWANAVVIHTAAAQAGAPHGAKVFTGVSVGAGPSYLYQPVYGLRPAVDYTLSAYCKTAVGKISRIYQNWHAADNTLLGSFMGDMGAAPDANWRRGKLTQRSPAVADGYAQDAAYCVVYYEYNAVGGGETYHVDAIQFEEGTLATGYAPKADELLPDIVTSTELATDAVGSGELATTAVRGSGLGGKVHLLPGSVMTNDLHADAITVTELAADAVTTVKLAADAVVASKLNVSVGGYNLVPDSSFEFGDVPGPGFLGAWAMYGGNPASAALTVVDGLAWTLVRIHGDKIARLYTGVGGGICGIVNGADAGRRMQMRAGEVHTVSAYVLTDDTVTTHGGHVHYIDSAGAIIGGGHGFTFPNAAAGLWARHKYTLPAAPSGTVAAMLYLWASAPTAGKNWYWEGVQVERGDVMTAYSPKADELAPGSVGSTTIAGGALDTHTITLQSGGKVQTLSGSVILGAADGLDLLASTVASPPNDRQIRWLTGAGAEVGSLVAMDYLGFKYLAARNSAGAELQVIDENGNSSFLQKGGTSLNRGRVRGNTATVNTTAARSGIATITHNLGATPAVVLVSSRTAQYLATTLNVGGSTFDISVNHIDGSALTSAVVVDWVAIG